MEPKKKSINPFLKKHKIKLSFVLITFLVWLFCLPKPLFKDPSSTVVKSREGIMMGARIADDGQWRFPKMDSVPTRFETCILHFEDEYFYSHPGFNPVSMSKALYQNLTTDKRRGGSTLTQQVIRLSRKNKARSYFEKVIEVFMATRLEARHSKKEVLNYYASYAPFGGNVVGLETASWRYYGIPASELSWGQSAALAVLPNAPSLIFPGKNEAILKKKRDRLLLKLFQKEIIDQTTYELAVAEDLPGKPLPLPKTAEHFTERVRREFPQQVVTSTIDIHLQRNLNAIVKDHHLLLKQNEINNLAVLILDVNTKEVLGYVGNAPTTKENNNYVDIITKSRSTGSVLKPFLYASVLHSGELLPNALVSDIPTVINGYTPENFDNKFNGAVPASTALSRSLNIPAVRMLRKYGLPRFYNTLQELQFTTIKQPADYYGLSLILGGAESSLWEVTNAYAGMASTLNFFNASSSEYRPNEFATPTFIKDAPVNFGNTQYVPSVFNAGAMYHTFTALQKVNRPQGEENWNFFSNSQPIAWKTGTSFGFKDAWAVGVTSQYAIGVWVGNADGEGRPGLTGIQAAAPVLFDVLDILPKSDWFAMPYDELIEAEVCSKSGYLKGLHCDTVETSWIPKEGVRSASCPYHKQVFLNKSESQQVNSSCYSLLEMQQKDWFVLPPVLEYYYAPLHPEYKILPAFKGDCLQEGESKMQFIFPKKNEHIVLPRNFKETLNEVIFTLAHRAPETKVFWYLDEQLIGETETFHEIAVAPTPGNYLLLAVDEEGNEVKQWVEIAMASE